jgi:hypothetical protein
MSNKSINAFVPGSRKLRTGADYMTWDASDPETWDSSYPHTWDDWQQPSFTTGGVNKTRNAKP